MLTHVDLRMERAHFAYAYWVEKGERAKVGGGFQGKNSTFYQSLDTLYFSCFLFFFLAELFLSFEMRGFC